MAKLDEAVRYVLSKGDEVEKASLGYVLEDRTPSRRVVDKLLNGQRYDGGWPPPWAEDYSSLDATCYSLDQARHLGLTKQEPGVGKALSFLLGRQGEDGSYEEEPKYAGRAPVWAKPGSEQAKMYLTAVC